MKRTFLLLALVLLWPVEAIAQQTPITATVTSPNNVPYALGTGSSSIVCPGNQAPTYNGYTVPRNQTIPGINGFGTFSMTVYDVNALQPAGCAYTFAICDITTAYCFTTGLIGGASQVPAITGSSIVNLSTVISAYAIPLPTGGGGSPFSVNSVVVPNPNLGNSPCITWAVAGSSIQGTVTVACQGGGGGGGSTVQINGVGATTANFTNNSSVSFTLAGNVVTAIAIAAGSEGGIQLNHNGQMAAVAGLGVDSTTSPTILNVPMSIGIKGPAPWYDVREYGAIPWPNAIAFESTTATTLLNSPNVTLAAAKSFQPGEGVVIYKAGVATSQSTPAAPTVTSPVMTGTNTFHYACMGIDALGGLTAASPSTVVGSTPTIFAPLAIGISSASITSNVLTVNFTANINASAGQEVSLVGLGGALSFLSGTVWNIASAPTSSQITVNITAANGSATITGASKGRLTNARNITAITRTGAVLTITTDANHNYLAATTGGGGQGSTLITVSNVSPADMNGDYRVLTASGNTITAQTALSYASTETGVVTLGSSVVNTQEYIKVSCPVQSGTTINYAIYGDSPSNGVTMTYLGETMLYEHTFIDWGPFFANGPAQRAYVPSTPPVSAQNQIYSGVITSGAGTTSLAVSPNVPTAGSFTIVHDETPGVQAAINAANSVSGGTVYLSPIANIQAQYILNSPLTLWNKVDLSVGTNVWANETVQVGNTNGSCAGGSKITAAFPGPLYTTSQFAQTNYMVFQGNAKTFLELNCGGSTLNGLMFSSAANGQNFVVGESTSYTDFENLAFVDAANAGLGGTNIGLTMLGQSTSDYWKNLTSLAYSAAGQGGIGGGGPLTYTSPLNPTIWVRACDNTSHINCSPAEFGELINLTGNNTINGRGILIDESYGGGVCQNYLFESDWDQAASTPSVSFYGNLGFLCLNVTVKSFLNDTSPKAVFANLTGSGMPGPVYLLNNTNSQWAGIGNGNLLTGDPVNDLTVATIQGIGSIGQNINTSITQSGSGSLLFPGYPYTGLSSAQVSPYPFTAQSKPFELTNNAPEFWPYAPISSLAGAVVSGGSVSVGSHTYCVSTVAWNGAWSACSNKVTVTTSSGNQTVNLTWTAVSGARGYQVFRDLAPMFAVGSGGGIFSFATTLTNSFSDSGVNAVGGASGYPAVDGGGITNIDGNQIIAPAFRAVNGPSSAVFSSDALGNALFNGISPSVSLVAQDAFQRGPSGSLGANWSSPKGGMQLVGFDQVMGISASADNLSYWIGSGAFSGPEYATVTVSAVNQNPSAQGAGAVVYGTGTAGTSSAYVCGVQDFSGLPSTYVPGQLRLFKMTAGTLSVLAQATVPSPRTNFNVTVFASPVGSTTNLSCAVDGVTYVSYQDSSSALSSGAPGIYIFSNFEDIVAGWSAGSSNAAGFYQIVQANSVNSIQEAKLNLKAGTNMTITCADNPGGTSTDCTFTASSTASVAWSALTPGTNSTSGTFFASGNSWDFSAGLTFKVPTAGAIFPGSGSGNATVVAEAAAGTPTLTLPNVSGTFAVTSSAPIVLNATSGNLTCPTCVTSSGGGAMTATAPITVSAAGLIAINNATTGAVGAIQLANNLAGTGSLPTVVSTTITGATSNFLVKFNGSGNIVNSAVTDTGTVNTVPEIFDTTTFPHVTEIPNAGATGTTVNKLASLTGAPSTAIITTHAVTGSIGIVAGGAGTGGSAQIAFVGQVSCVFDGATTAGHFVTISATVDGDCTDGGTTAPTNMPTIYVLSTNGAAGTYAVAMFGGSSGSGSGTGTVNNCGFSLGSVAYYATTGTAVSCLSSVTISAGALNIGVANSIGGSLSLFGATSGKVTISTQAAAGTYSWVLPNTAGTSGFLVTAGNPMTYTSPTVTVNGQACTVGSACSLSTVFANVTLSNLTAPTALNADLLCATSASCNIGSNSVPINNIFINGSIVFTTISPIVWKGPEGSCTGASAGFDVLDIGCTSPHGMAESINGAGFFQVMLGNSPMNQFGVVYANGDSTPMTALAPPAIQGQYAVMYQPATNVAVAPAIYQLGLGGRTLTGAGTSDNVLFSDNLNIITHVHAATGTMAEALPTPTTLNNPAFGFSYCNDSPQTDTITPAGGYTIQAGNTAAAASLSIGPGICYRIRIDTTASATNWIADISQASSGGGTPCTTTALSFQYNNAGVFGCAADFTLVTHTFTGGASGLFDLSAMSTTTGLKIPTGAGAVPVTDGFISVNSTIHALVSGSNSNTLVQAVAATGTTVSTTCSNQVFTVISGSAAPTCTTLTASFLPAAVVYTNAANTFTSAGTLDLSASTVADAFKTEVKAGFTSGVNGSFGFDSTNKNYHGFCNGADCIITGFASTPVTGHLVSVTVSSGNILLSDSGVTSPALALGSGSGTAGQLACATSSNTQGNCTTTPPNNFIGIFLSGGVTYATTGIVSVVIDATQNVTFGDILCASTTAGKAHDNLTIACANGEWVGVVTTTASSVSTVTASLRLQ
jgi:hypothetical protein